MLNVCGIVIYHSDLEFPVRQMWANNADPDQGAVGSRSAQVVTTVTVGIMFYYIAFLSIVYIILLVLHQKKKTSTKKKKNNNNNKKKNK